jgi:DNA-binding transcriptional ArsR family regulator
MVKDAVALDRTFGALADPTRRAIVARLARGASAVTALAEPFSISLPAVSKHLKVLEQAGLVAREKRGRVHHLRLEAGPLRDAARWIEQHERFWQRQLDALERYVTAKPRKKKERR